MVETCSNYILRTHIPYPNQFVKPTQPQTRYAYTNRPTQKPYNRTIYMFKTLSNTPNAVFKFANNNLKKHPDVHPDSHRNPKGYGLLCNVSVQNNHSFFFGFHWFHRLTLLRPLLTSFASRRILNALIVGVLIII